MDLLGDLKEKKVLDIQCHFGQDSISLSRLGAEIIEVNLSDQSIKKAQELAAECNSNAHFICSNIYDLPQHLNQKFGLVFTSYGTIPWRPNLSKWSDIINHFLTPSGKFVFIEFHPIVWMFDDNLEKIACNNLNKKAVVESEEGSYAAGKADLKDEYVCWNHGLSGVISSLQISNLP